MNKLFLIACIAMVLCSCGGFTANEQEAFSANLSGEDTEVIFAIDDGIGDGGEGEEGKGLNVFKNGAGWYKFELWGARGENAYLLESGEGKPAMVGEGGQPGYASIEVYMVKGTSGKIGIAGIRGGHEVVEGTKTYDSKGGNATVLYLDLNDDGVFSTDERLVVAAGGGGGLECVTVGEVPYWGVMDGGSVGDATSGDWNTRYGLTGGPGKYHPNAPLQTTAATPTASTQTASGTAGTPGGQPGKLTGEGGAFNQRVLESVGNGGGGFVGGASGGHQYYNASGASGTNFALGFQGAKPMQELVDALALKGLSTRNPQTRAWNDPAIPEKNGEPVDNAGHCNVTFVGTN